MAIAHNDLDDIWRYSAETWSIAQADRYIDDLVRVFETIAALPPLVRERLVFDPPVRIHTHESHLVIYAVAKDSVTVLRVLGARQDWISLLKAADLYGRERCLAVAAQTPPSIAWRSMISSADTSQGRRFAPPRSGAPAAHP